MPVRADGRYGRTLAAWLPPGEGCRSLATYGLPAFGLPPLLGGSLARAEVSARI